MSKFYANLEQGISAMIDSEVDYVANCANVSAMVYHELQAERGENAVNWVGFYFIRNNLHPGKPHQLVLGPFCGKPACIRIPIGKGVCGVSALTAQPQIVPDVHKFPGHISCDARSKSEIVIPLIVDGVVIGVFDLDCPVLDGFDETDAKGLRNIVQILVNSCDWSLFKHLRH